MEAQEFITLNIILNSGYLLFTLSQRRYRLLLPSVISSFTWLIASILMMCETSGALKPSFPIHYDYAAPFIFYMGVSSVIAFSIAHFAARINDKSSQSALIPTDVLNQLVVKFRWVLYVVAVCALCILLTLYSIGGFSSYGTYRELAVTTEFSGLAGLAIRISNHLSLVGAFYLIILGMKQARTGLQIKELSICIILYGAANIAIAGRGWIVAASLPFINGFILERYRLNRFLRKPMVKIKPVKVISFFVMLGVLFSILGEARSDMAGATKDSSFFQKFLYYTDGLHMSDIILRKYKPGSFEHELGNNTVFLHNESKMAKRFNAETNNRYKVVVKSVIPPLYYDFGYEGGILFWGMLCFVLEFICLRNRYTKNLIGCLLFCSLSYILYQAPIGNVIRMSIPMLEWLLIIFIFRKYVFRNIHGIKPYL